MIARRAPITVNYVPRHREREVRGVCAKTTHSAKSTKRGTRLGKRGELGQHLRLVKKFPGVPAPLEVARHPLPQVMRQRQEREVLLPHDHLLAVPRPRAVHGKHDGGHHTNHHNVERSSCEHGKDGDPDLPLRTRSLLAVPDAEHVRQRLEEREEVLRSRACLDEARAVR